MGWQSYVIFYTNKTEVENIIKTINEYQQIVHSNVDNNDVGEELQHICFSKMIKPYAKRFKGTYAVMFGIGGGRSECQSFFFKKGIMIHYFVPGLLKRLDKQDYWFKPFDNNFMKFPDNFCEKLLENDLLEL